jgi:hypothetical protein
MMVIWNRIDLPGKEWCQLRGAAGKHILEGIVLLTYAGKPCHLEYAIECDSSWQTRKVSINGRIGRKAISSDLTVNSKRQWRLNGKLVLSVEGSVDVDLGFSPSTNLLPIKRLRLGMGKQAEVTAAWVEFPSLRVKPLTQTYLRSKLNTFHYESAGGKFQRDMIVNEKGFVTSYPGLWELEAAL